MTWLNLHPITMEFTHLLVFSLCGCAIFILGSKLWKGILGRGARHVLRSIKLNLSQVCRRLAAKGKANEGAIAILFVVAMSAMFFIYAYKSRWPLVTEYNLRIEKKVGPNQWWIVSDEHPDGFMYYACSDFNNDEWIQAGYYVRVAHWQVRDGCNSIRDQGLEFDYAWKADGHAKTIKEAGYE